MQKYLGSVVPIGDNYFAALNSAVFSDGSFCYVPKGVRCPMELSTYFRINAADTGQFERTLIIAEDDAYVSYLEGCTAPMRDKNQLHAAVVELVALDHAEIKYSTVQNWYPGDKNGVGGIYNFVTKRGACRGRKSKISWTQVETGSAITWKYPSVLLKGDDSVGEFYSVAVTNNHQQADTGTKMIHIGKNTSSTIISKGISAGQGQNTYRGLVKIAKGAVGARNYTQCDSLLIGDKCGAHTFPYIEVRHPLAGRARGDDLEDQRRPAVLLPPARHRAGGRGLDDRQRLLQGRLQEAADGVRGRGAEAPRREPRRLGRIATTQCRMLEIKDLHVEVDGKQILKGLDLDGRRRRGARDHGTERLGQEHARARARRPPRLRGHRRARDLRRPRPARARRRRAARARACSSRSSTRSRSRASATCTSCAPRSTPRARSTASRSSTPSTSSRLARAKMKLLDMPQALLERSVNEGFSGGEKKRNEIFQMAMLEPRLAMLDETDSGLDIDALRIVADGVNALRGPERAMVVITHYQRLLDYIVPDFVHVLSAGRIVESGGKELALELEKKGYGWVHESPAEEAR